MSDVGGGNENINIFQLAKQMLSPKTLPHLVLASIMSASIFILVKISDVFGAVASISLSLSYLILAMLANNNTLSNLTTIGEGHLSKTTLSRFFSSFKITVVPLLISAVLFGAILFSIGGKENNWVVPLLGFLFVIWSIAQSISFRVGMVEWFSNGLGDAKLHTYRERISTSSQVVIVQSFSFLTIWIGQMLTEAESMTLKEAFLGGFLFICLTLVVQIFTLWLTKDEREAAGSEKGLAAFSFKWMVIAQLFITWHLFTIYRRTIMDPTSTATLIEEAILMALTVLFAVWSLTTYTVKDGKRLVSEKAALPLAISFAYAYAGSVSVLSVAFDGVNTVLIIGHFLSILTMIFLLNPTLRNSRISSDIISASARFQKDEPITNTTTEQDDDHPPTGEEVWQEDNEIDWDEGNNIAKDTDWDGEDVQDSNDA